MVALLLLLTACNDHAPPAQSTPVQEGDSVRVELGSSTPVDDPVSPEELSVAYPELSMLPQYAMLSVVGTLNLVPGPCEPCADSLARCVLEQASGCENLPGLVERAIALAGEGSDPNGLRVALSYPDVWIQDDTSTQTEDIDVEVWIDPSAPTVPGSLERLTQLQAALGEVPVQFHIRVLWSNEEEDERAKALALLAAEEQAAGRAFLVAGDASPGASLDVQVFSARLDDPALAARLTAEQAIARTKGVRSAPTWFVEGYRLRGLQSTQSISHLIALAREDLRLASSAQEVVTP